MTNFFRSQTFEGARSFAQAQKLARLLKKSGTSAADARDRIQKTYNLSDQELRSVLRAVWGAVSFEGANTLSAGYYNVRESRGVYILIGPFSSERDAIVNYAATKDRRVFEREVRGEHGRLRLPFPSYFEVPEIESLVEDPGGYGYTKVVVKKPSVKIHRSWSTLVQGDVPAFIRELLWRGE